MATYPSERRARSPYQAGGDWRGRSDLARRSYGGTSPGLLLAGVAAVALGAFAVYYFGPDLRRYLKMEAM